MTNHTLTIATRQSPLALWQAEFIKAELQAHHADLSVKLLPMTTKGDKLLDKSLQWAGGKGLFVKELEKALLQGDADIAVHSMKDMPAQCPKELIVAGMTARESVFDVLVSNNQQSLQALPDNAIIGTASARREVQLKALKPHAQVKLCRGNVNTRLKKLEAHEYDGILLADAGLRRLGFEAHISQQFTVDEFIPAPGQGALGIQCRASDATCQHFLTPLLDQNTLFCVNAEREISNTFGGGCHLSIAVYAFTEGEHLFIKSMIGDPHSDTIIKAAAMGPCDTRNSLVQYVITQLTDKGAFDIIGQ